jgi:hypothetical protein
MKRGYNVSIRKLENFSIGLIIDIMNRGIR